MSLKDPKDFWKEIKKQSSVGATPLASTVNGASGVVNITQMWSEHFSNLLNSSSDMSRRDFVLAEISKLNNLIFLLKVFAPHLL